MNNKYINTIAYKTAHLQLVCEWEKIHKQELRYLKSFRFVNFILNRK